MTMLPRGYMETVTELGVGHSQLIRYAFDVLEAIGIQYGPVHGEYMVDEKGPVLIEGNPFPGHDLLQLPPHAPDGIGVLPYFRQFISFL